MKLLVTILICTILCVVAGQAAWVAHPKQFIKHLTKCQQVLNTGDGFVIAGANTQTK